MGEVIKTKAGELTVLETWTERYGSNGKFYRMCNVLCFCGSLFKSRYRTVKIAEKKSCGCINFFTGNDNGHKHGHCPARKASPTYKAWARAKTRCYNPDGVSYHLYGGKGIKLCNEWLEFQGFLDDVGEKPAGHRFLRIDKDGDYEPDNCEWVPVKGKRRKK